MALIGARTDAATGERWFLLQNWWSHIQFVEVSESYLKSAEAMVCFVKTPQMKIPDEFPTYTAPYGENENVDKEDTYALDGPGCEDPSRRP